MAETAVAAVTNDATDAQVTAAEDAIKAIETAIMAAANVPAHEKTAFTGTHNALLGQLNAAKISRQKAMDDARKAKDKEMMETAKKLYDGISAPTDSTSNDSRRYAAYGQDENANNIAVSIGTAEAVNLSEDKKTMVDDLHGWKGKRYTRTTPASEGMYEAHVYSNIGDPVEGDPFEEQYPNTLDYVSDGVVTVNTSTDNTPASRVASSLFDQSAGTKSFKLADNLAVTVRIAGTFHGVAGTYSCTPGATTVTCAANVASSGFELGTTNNETKAFSNGGGTWKFTPTDKTDKVMSVDDVNYASYGWWIHKSSDDNTWTASAFVDEKGDVPAASGINDLNGKATYKGGAAGKYALRSSTGGTNDAGHFTARATLTADFTNNTSSTAITGTIDNFIGADGQSRDWEVELKGSTISDTGVIGNSTSGTVWTIGETDASDSGQWSGALRDNGTDNVPKVATGTFYSTYNDAGRMVGAFGANKE